MKEETKEEHQKIVNWFIGLLPKSVKFTQLKVDRHPKKGTYCLRCGMDKKDIRREKHICNSWGKSYERHLYK